MVAYLLMRGDGEGWRGVDRIGAGPRGGEGSLVITKGFFSSLVACIPGCAVS